MGAASIEVCKKSATKLVDELGKESEKLAKQLEEWKKQRAAIEKKLSSVSMDFSQKLASVECPTQADKDLTKIAGELAQKVKQKVGPLKSYADIDTNVDLHRSANRLVFSMRVMWS